MNLKEIIMQYQLTDLLNQSQYGIEKECIRVDENGDTLAMTPHPSVLGERESHPYIQTDYSESQPEIITPPLPGIETALGFLKGLNDVLYRSLESNEYLWPYSIPCYLPDDQEIPITQSKDESVVKYREETGRKYSRSRQVMSGMHINFSLSQELIDHLFERITTFEKRHLLENYLYLKLARHFLRYQWVLVYLFGATPVAREEFFVKATKDHVSSPNRPMRSIRNSHHGFFNDTTVTVRYDDIEHYIEDIHQHIAKKTLMAEREFYSPVRLRSSFGKRLEQLQDTGIQYLEFRSMDLNPFSPVGMTKEESEFFHLFIVFLLLKEEISTYEEVNERIDKSKEVAGEDPLQPTKYAEEGKELLEDMQVMMKELGWDEAADVISRQQKAFDDPKQTLSGQIVSLLEDKPSYIDLGRELGQQYKKEALQGPFQLQQFPHLTSEEAQTVYEMMKNGESWDSLKTILYPI